MIGDKPVFLNIVNKTITSISRSVSQVGSYVFQNCASLATVSFPECAAIKNNAFENCTKLKSISLPKCTEIDNNAFYGCSILSIVTIGTSNCTLGTDALGGTSILPTGSIYVPSTYINTYKNALNWSQYASRIFGY